MKERLVGHSTKYVKQPQGHVFRAWRTRGGGSKGRVAKVTKDIFHVNRGRSLSGKKKKKESLDNTS
jgi:hypothetical protein